jgi:hypothetical protein
VDDRQKVLGKLVLGSTLFFSAVNHESHLMAVEDGLESLKREATEPVTEGNYKFFDSSFQDEVQKGLQSPALDAEA